MTSGNRSGFSPVGPGRYGAIPQGRSCSGTISAVPTVPGSSPWRPQFGIQSAKYYARIELGAAWWGRCGGAQSQAWDRLLAATAKPLLKIAR